MLVQIPRLKTEVGGCAHEPTRLVQAAHEFEAQMMKELLKPLSESTSLIGEGEEGSSMDALGTFASEALGNALSQQGGLGIADSILHHFSDTKLPACHSDSLGATMAARTLGAKVI
jgi:Rod binding domain-containing protein